MSSQNPENYIADTYPVLFYITMAIIAFIIAYDLSGGGF